MTKQRSQGKPNPRQHVRINVDRCKSILAAPVSHFFDMGAVKETRDGALIYVDNGTNVLAVAHLDSVSYGAAVNYQATLKGEWYVFAPTVDDRLGAYIIADLLPSLGIKTDILLTEGEETGRSTAKYFEPPEGKKYNWMFSFDRRGVDVVMYQYEDKAMRDILTNAGFYVGFGSFSDICFLHQLGCKGFNFGTGYYNNHGKFAHFVVERTTSQIKKFIKFYDQHKDVLMAHTQRQYDYSDGRCGAWLSDTQTDLYDQYGLNKNVWVKNENNVWVQKPLVDGKEWEWVWDMADGWMRMPKDRKDRKDHKASTADTSANGAIVTLPNADTTDTASQKPFIINGYCLVCGLEVRGMMRCSWCGNHNSDLFLYCHMRYAQTKGYCVVCGRRDIYHSPGQFLDIYFCADCGKEYFSPTPDPAAPEERKAAAWSKGVYKCDRCLSWLYVLPDQIKLAICPICARLHILGMDGLYYPMGVCDSCEQGGVPLAWIDGNYQLCAICLDEPTEQPIASQGTKGIVYCASCQLPFAKEDMDNGYCWDCGPVKGRGAIHDR